ncbi:hypothetical protein DPMN_025395 [Dreissena polymorpha]|uniref:Uncharacterized protein n=1 Tax=Dreissena polymorpha TaxID=45954 RepID=A0A9D4LRG7_DREPO|nr:hypothetical protein DPMN_025395 [Dreissena polymorpha]
MKQDTPKRNIIILMGDLNAKTGSDNQGYEEARFRRGEQQRREKFTDKCATSNLVIRGSVFHHRRIQRAT